MDAGPNIKLIFKEAFTSDVEAAFPKAEIVDPFSR